MFAAARKSHCQLTVLCYIRRVIPNLAALCMLLHEMQGYKGTASTECVMQNEFMLELCSYSNCNPTAGTYQPSPTLIVEPVCHCAQTAKKRKHYACRRQFNEKPSIIPGCPGQIVDLDTQPVSAGNFFYAGKMCSAWRMQRPTCWSLVTTVVASASGTSSQGRGASP